MSTIGNIIWFICGGLITSLLWIIVGILLFFTIVGIPWARACFVIAKFNLCPFGRELISRKELSGKSDIGTGIFGLMGNVIWFVFAGWWLAISHIIAACLSAVTIIGIPFSLQHLKLAAISLAPIGKSIVKKDIAEAARMKDASVELGRIRGIDSTNPST